MATTIVPSVHLKSDEITEAISQSIRELQKELLNNPLYGEYISWCNESQLQRFLVARQGKSKEALELANAALKWRKSRLPPGGITQLKNWETFISKESETGKIFIPGNDHFGRPVLVMDNSVQNTHNDDDQLTFLAWNLDFACELMPSNIDKYVVVLNLKNFSLFNSPSIKSCTETIFMLCNGFPERLGHLIVYKPPYALYVLYNAVKGLIDPKTISKIFFITEADAGTQGDALLTEVIGTGWRALTRVDEPIVNGCASGYRHEEYWGTVLERVQGLEQKKVAVTTNTGRVDINHVEPSSTTTDAAKSSKVEN